MSHDHWHGGSRRRKLGSISSAGMRPRRSKRWNEFSALIPKPEAQLLFADSYIMRRDITADLLHSECYRNSEHPRWEPFLRIDVASDGAKPMSDSHGERAWSRLTIQL
jgi:hypothetical protein